MGVERRLVLPAWREEVEFRAQGAGAYKQHEMWRDTTGQTTEAEWQRELPHLLPKDITPHTQRRGGNIQEGVTPDLHWDRQGSGWGVSGLLLFFFFLANWPTFITPLKKAQFHRPPSMTEGSGTEPLIVWFQLLTDLPARKWSHCLFEGGRAGGSLGLGSVTAVGHTHLKGQICFGDDHSASLYLLGYLIMELLISQRC